MPPGTLTKHPSWSSMPGQERKVYRECFTRRRVLRRNAANFQLGRYVVGELSLFGEPKCLSLPNGSLAQARDGGVYPSPKGAARDDAKGEELAACLKTTR
jgi:hypothetical protein